MPRYESNMGVTAKIEATAGTYTAPSAATDGLLIVDKVDFKPLNIKTYDRNLLRSFMGASQGLITQYNRSVSFQFEMAPSGTAGTAAPWGILIQAAAAAQASLTTPSRIEHTPVSTGFKTLSMDINDDGVKHPISGLIGSVAITGKVGEVVKAKFDGIGIYGTPTAVALPSIPTTAWKTPLALTKANVTDVTLGCTYATGALSGGTSFGSMGFELDLGVKTEFFQSLSSERAEVQGREAKIKLTLELAAAAEITAYSDMLANAVTSFGFKVGSAAGNTLIFFAPSISREDVSPTSQAGIRLHDFSGKCLPVSGNDDWLICQA